MPTKLHDQFCRCRTCKPALPVAPPIVPNGRSIGAALWSGLAMFLPSVAAADRALRFEAGVRATFGEQADEVLHAIRIIGLASCRSTETIRTIVMQIYARGRADRDDLRSLWDACPVAFKTIAEFYTAKDAPASEVIGAIVARLELLGVR